MTSRLVVLTALLVGCFTEPTVDPGDDGETGSPSCSQGAVGCACYGNGTCDPGLGCATNLQLCVPEDCTPGEASCVCAEGECVSPSECISGICELPGADDGGSGSLSASDGDDGRSSTTSASDADGTGGATSSGDTTSSTDPDTTDSGEPSCDELRACGPCFDCVDLPTGICGDAHATCMRVAGCMTAASCLSECGLTGLCFEACCEGLGRDQVAAVNALMFCRTDHCTSSCGRYEIPICE